MLYADVNIMAVVLAAVATMGLGFVWYSPMLFGNAYMKVMTCDKKMSAKEIEEMKKTMGPAYGLMFVGSLISAYILAVFLGTFQFTTIEANTTVAFWAWLGFMAPVCLGNALFGMQSGNARWLLLGITGGHYLVQMMIMTIILTLWR